MSSSRARAEACANIALAKYWGKSSLGGNLTAVPSLSLTLDALRTRTEVTFDSSFVHDEIELNGRLVEDAGKERVTRLLDRLRLQANDVRHARVVSSNNFPTAAGLASSASGFAALAVAAAGALDLRLTVGQLSGEARRGSASAARSLFGGFAELEKEVDEARSVAPRDHWDVAMIVAVIEAGPKPIASTGGMIHTALTSPYYGAWLEAAPALFADVKAGVLDRDFERVAVGMEHSTRLMHATMITSLPPVLYLRGTTVELMHEIAARRAQGFPEAYTMDAGPNVKVLTTREHAERTRDFLASVPGVSRVLVCTPGPAATLLSLDGDLSSASALTETA